MALEFAVGQRTSAHSDHYPFFMAGVPTGGMQSADLSLAGRGYGHTQYDTVDKVDPTCLREASTLAARLIFATVRGTVVEWVLHGSDTDPEEFAEGLAQILTHGLVKRPEAVALEQRSKV